MEIEFTITPEGELTYKVIGVQGSGCKQFGKGLDALGEVVETGLTEEYNQLPPDPLLVAQGEGTQIKQTEML